MNAPHRSDLGVGAGAAGASAHSHSGAGGSLTTTRNSAFRAPYPAMPYSVKVPGKTISRMGMINSSGPFT